MAFPSVVLWQAALDTPEFESELMRICFPTSRLQFLRGNPVRDKPLSGRCECRDPTASPRGSRSSESAPWDAECSEKSTTKQIVLAALTRSRSVDARLPPSSVALSGFAFSCRHIGVSVPSSKAANSPTHRAFFCVFSCRWTCARREAPAGFFQCCQRELV